MVLFKLILIILAIGIFILAEMKIFDYFFRRKIEQKRRKQRDAYIDELLGPLNKEDVNIHQIIDQKAQHLKNLMKEEIVKSILLGAQKETCPTENTIPVYEEESDLSEEFSKKQEEIAQKESSEEQQASLLLLKPITDENMEQSDLNVQENDVKQNNLPSLVEVSVVELEKTIEPEEVSEKSAFNAEEILAIKEAVYESTISLELEPSSLSNAFDNIIRDIQKKQAAAERVRIINEEAREIRRQNIEVIERKIEQKITEEIHENKTQSDCVEKYNKELEKRKQEAVRIAEKERLKKEKKQKK